MVEEDVASDVKMRAWLKRAILLPKSAHVFLVAKTPAIWPSMIALYSDGMAIRVSYTAGLKRGTGGGCSAKTFASILKSGCGRSDP